MFFKSKAFVMLAAVLALGGCKKESGAGDAAQVPTVAAVKVEPQNIPLSFEFAARAQGSKETEVRARVGGILLKRNYVEGSQVEEGSVLFQIDPEPFKVTLNQAKAKLAQVNAELKNAETQWQRTEKLYKEKYASEKARDDARANLDSLAASAQLAQAEAQEISARNNLSYTEVKSPSDGVVGALPYRVGALVGANLPYPLTTVSDNSDMYVYFSMTENQLLALTRQYGSMDEALKNMPEVELILNDNSVYNKKGVIESISGVIDRQTGTVMARVVFPNESRLLHSGASGTVVVPSIYKDCIAIPQGATVQMQDKVVVYKVVDGKAVSTLITVAGINDGREYVVLSGLQSGDEIISEGAGLVREGTQVK